MSVISDFFTSKFFRFGLFSNSEDLISGDYTPQFHNKQIGNTNPTFLPVENLNDIYHRVAPLNLVITRIAKMLSNGKWKLYDQKGEEIEKHEILNRLNNPNIIQSGTDFLFQSSLAQDIYGNAFIYKNMGISNIPQSLWVVPEMKVVTTGKIYHQTKIEDIIKGYEIDGLNKTYNTNEVILIKGDDSGTIYSESKIKTLIPQISNIYQAYRSRNVLITERGGVGFITIDPSGQNGNIPMDKADKKRVEEEWRKNYGIKKGQKLTNFSSVPLKFVPTNIPTKDLMLFEEVMDDLRIICDTYGYNINLLSNEKGATFINAKEYEKQVMQNTIIPRGEKIANKFTKEFKLDEKGMKLKLDFSHVQSLQEDGKLKSEILKNNIEALERLNRLEEEGADQEIIDILKEKLKY